MFSKKDIYNLIEELEKKNDSLEDELVELKELFKYCKNDKVTFRYVTSVTLPAIYMCASAKHSLLIYMNSQKHTISNVDFYYTDKIYLIDSNTLFINDFRKEYIYKFDKKCLCEVPKDSIKYDEKTICEDMTEDSSSLRVEKAFNDYLESEFRVLKAEKMKLKEEEKKLNELHRQSNT